MKRLKPFLIRSGATLGFCFGLLVLFLLQPALLYSKHSTHDIFDIHHQEVIDLELFAQLDSSLYLVRKAEIFDPHMRIDLCLNDGSRYPQLVKSVLGLDPVRAFSNQLVIHGHFSESATTLRWRERELNTVQFIAHGLVHNIQFHYHGLWDANPLGQHPEWKWEGYADYVVLSKKYPLLPLCHRLLHQLDDPYAWTILEDNDQSLNLHFRYLLLTQFCLDILQLSYDQFMQDQRSEEEIYQSLLRWYQEQ